jgi:iron complex transport system substrate-binding protein
MIRSNPIKGMFSHKTHFIVVVIALMLTLIGGVFAQEDVLVVTHNQGETEVPFQPETVLTFDIASLSTLHALGIEVAGVPAFAYPETLAQYEGDEYEKIGSLFEPDYEAVNALEADLIITGGRSSAVYPQLSEIATAIDLAGNNADFLAAQKANAEVLGEIFGKQDEVAELWANIEASVEAVNEVTAEAGKALVVMVSGGNLSIFGPGSRFGWIHTDLGFEPVFEDVDQATHGAEITAEFLLEANPDWFIVIDRDSAVEQSGEAAESVLDNELVQQTTAWQNDQVIYLSPSNWYIVMGGLGAIQEMVDEVSVALGIEAGEPAEVPTEVIVSHNQGETVVPYQPETVLTFDIASLSTLHALGIDVAGVPAFAFPETLAQYEGDEYEKIGSLFEPDYEAVNALEADLIIVAARSSTVYPQLSEIATTIDLTADNSNFLATQKANAEVLGEIFGKQDEVAELWGAIEASVEAVNEATAEAGKALVVMVSGGNLSIYGPGSRFGWIHTDLGFEPVFENVDDATHGAEITAEFLLEANPDWFIVIDRDSAVGQSGEAAESVLDNELVQQTTAWQNDQVIYLSPSNWYIVMGGLGAVQEMVSEIAVALGVE